MGLNVKDTKAGYYKYLASYIYDNEEFLQLTNLSPEEAGMILCVLEKDFPIYYALGKTVKEMLGLENTFVLVE